MNSKDLQKRSSLISKLTKAAMKSVKGESGIHDLKKRSKDMPQVTNLMNNGLQQASAVANV